MLFFLCWLFFFFQAEDGIRDLLRSRGLGDVYKRQDMTHALTDDQRKAYEANIPLKRLGKGDDVANACVFLGSDLSTYVTGQVLSAVSYTHLTLPTSDLV